MLTLQRHTKAGAPQITFPNVDGKSKGLHAASSTAIGGVCHNHGDPCASLMTTLYDFLPKIRHSFELKKPQWDPVISNGWYEKI